MLGSLCGEVVHARTGSRYDSMTDLEEKREFSVFSQAWVAVLETSGRASTNWDAEKTEQEALQ